MSIHKEEDFDPLVIHIGPVPTNQNISKDVQQDLKPYTNYPDEIRSIEMKMQRGELAGITYNEESKMYEYKGKTPEQKEKNQMLALKDMDRIAETAVAIRQKYLPDNEFKMATKDENEIDIKDIKVETETKRKRLSAVPKLKTEIPKEIEETFSKLQKESEEGAKKMRGELAASYKTPEQLFDELEDYIEGKGKKKKKK